MLRGSVVAYTLGGLVLEYLMTEVLILGLVDDIVG